MPIEIEDICQALVEMGYQDDIRVTGETMNLEQLKGAYVQWTESDGVYADPKLVSLIVYPSNVDLYAQRIICAKELIHICDANVVKTHDPDEIAEIARVLCTKAGVNDIMQIARAKVAKDVLATTQGLMLLFPKAARIIAHGKLETDQVSLSDLEEIVQLPKKLIKEMLAPEWEDIAQALLNF